MMTRTLNYQKMFALTPNTTTSYNNEEIVVDERVAYTPSDLVQQKLQSLLSADAIPVSCLHTGRQVRRYNS